MLVRLLYASRAAEPVSTALIDKVLAQSMANNPAMGITGVLCHGGGVFMQALEGGRAAVNALYARLLTDPRHRDVQILHFEETCERRFAGWTMGQVNLAKTNPSLLLKYGERPTLEPFGASGRASMALLEELIATASIIGRAG